MKVKTERMLKVLESPGLYDEEFVRSLLEDPETAEIYKAINKTADSLTVTNEPDIDKEWNAFLEVRRHLIPDERPGVFRWLQGRNVAAVVVIATASLGLLAAGIGIGYKASRKSVVADVENAGVYDSSADKVASVAGDTLANESSDCRDSSLTVFKDESLEKILDEISRYYGIQVVYRSDSVKDLRLYFQWNRSQPLDETVSRLNLFQQLNIIVSDETIIVE